PDAHGSPPVVSVTFRAALGAVLIAALLTVASTASAAHPATTLEVSPSILDLRLKPGESTTRTVTVIARGSAPLDVRFQHADFGFEPSSYSPTFVEDSSAHTTPFSTRGWFSTGDRHFHLAPGGVRHVTVRVKAPDNAEPGTHLGAAFFVAS